MKKSLLALLTILAFSMGLMAQTYHVNEDFNSGSLPTGWTNTAVTGSAAWSFGSDGSVDHSGNNNLDGTSFAYFDDSNLGGGSTNNMGEIVTPAFDNSANGATFLEFDYNFRHFGATVPDSFYVEVFDGTNWNVVFSRDYDDCGSYVAFTCTNNFPHANIDISAYKNAACQVRFVYFDGNDWGWYVGLDNVVISSPLADDIGVTALLGPKSSCGLSATDTIEVRIYNYGANAAAGFPVSYIINGGTPVTETVSASIPGGDSLDYTFTTTANLSTLGVYNVDAYTSYVLDGASANDSISGTVENYQVFQPTYFEGFDAGLGGWQISGNNSSWAAGVPAGTRISASAGGTGSLVTNLSGLYNSNELSYVTSPCLDFSALTSDPFISFSLNYQTENSFDEFWVEYSTDDGATWSKIPSNTNSVNWYSNTSANVWTGSNSGWAKSESTIPGSAGQSKVKVRFVFSSDGGANFEGVGIDNFTIKGQLPIDLEMVSLDGPTPTTLCGYGPAEIVTVTILNKGTTPITTFDAGYRLNGGTAVLQNAITPTSPIAPNATYQFSFAQTANMQATSNYVLDVWASTAGDGFVPNDSLVNAALPNPGGGILSTPYNEGFDGFTVGSTFSNTNDAISGGWTRYSSSTGFSDYLWRVGESTANRSGSTGPGADFSGNGYFMYTEASQGSSGDTAFLESPCLDLSTVNGATLSFWWHRYGSAIGNMYLDIYDGSQWVNAVVTLSTTPQTSSGDPWIEETVSLSAYAGSRIKIRFRAVSQGCCAGDMAIDEILIFEPIPQDAKLDAILSPSEGCGLTANSTVIASVENFGTTTIAADSLYMYYQVDNLPPVKDTVNVAIPVAAIINHTFAIGPDLSTSGQTYNLKVWTELNGDSNIGNDTAYLTITNNVKTLPFFEDFQSFGTQTSPTGWTFDPSTTSGVYWRSNTGSTGSTNTGPNGDHTTGNGRYVYLETSSSGGPGYLVSPCIDLTNVSGAVLNFWYHKYGSGMNDLFVDVFDNSLGIWVNNIGVVRGETHTSSTDPWKEAFVGLSQYAGKQINFRFRGLDDASGFRGDMAIDDVLIFEPIPQDAKTDSLISPESGCDLTPNELLCVNIENFGTQDITSIKVGYSINNGPPVYDSAVGILIIPGAKLQYCFNSQRANLSAPGNYDFKIWTDLNGDTNVDNDTLYETVINETILFPDCEDFEGLTDAVGEGGNDLFEGKFSNNWVANQGEYTWEFGSRTSAPGPSNDHSPTGLGRYMVIDNSNGQNGAMAVLTSPCYDLTTVAVANLEFWYHTSGSANNRMYVDVFDGQLWQFNVDSVVGNSNAWTLKRVSLANYTGNFVNVRFRAFKLGGTYTLDDICVVPPPPNQAQMVNILRPVDDLCFYSTSEPVRVRMKNIGSNSIDSLEVRIVVDTNIGNSTTNFAPYFDSTIWAYPGANPPTWDPGDLYVYETPFGVDMSRYKTYRFRAQLILNGDLDVNDDAISNYRVTHKDPVKFPYIEGFEGISCGAGGPYYSPIGFTRSEGDYAWEVKCGPSVIGLTGPARDHTRKNNFGRYFVTNASLGDIADVAILETPCFDMSTLNKPTFKFWYHMFGFQMGVLYIDINADNGWVTLDSILGQQQINNASPWLQRSIDLGAYAGTYAKVRFRSLRGDGGASNMAIDDLFVYDLSQYDIGPLDVVTPGSDNFSCYSANQEVHVELLNYGARDLDFTVDTMRVEVEILKDGVPWDTLFREVNTNIYYNLSQSANTPLPSDSNMIVWVNNSSDGNSTFDMSTVGSVFTFNVTTEMKRDSVDNNDDYTENITTQIAGGSVSVDNNSICNGTIVRLNATGFFGAPKWERKYFGPGGTSFWLPEFNFGSDSAEYVVQPDTSAWYRIRICGSDVVSDSVFVSVTVVKTPDPIHDTICGGGNMTVEAFADPIHNLQAVNWYHNQNDTAPFFVSTSTPFTHTDYFLETDTFWMEGVIDSCVSLSRNPVYAVVNPYPVIDLGLANDTLCMDTNKVLNAGAGVGYTYAWEITAPDGSITTSDLQTIGINPLDLSKDSTYKYDVTVTSQFGCATLSSTVSVYITDSCFVGINDQQIEDQITVYPNPTNGEVYLKTKDQVMKGATIEIQSIDGKLLWSEDRVNLNQSEYKIDLGKLADGVYFIKVNTSEGTLIKKLVKN